VTADRRSEGAVFDELLVVLAQGGDPEALERLAHRWRPRHYAHARRLLGDADRAADAVQESWVGIVRGLLRLQDPAGFPAWSYAIVTRRCRDRQRTEARAPVSHATEAIAPGTRTLDEAVDLRAALAALPPDQRAAVALFYRHGFTGAEIAEALCVPVGTVKSRLFHARRALRRYFQGDQT
jgi:RNA polymerase sigma-70 factor (ECF subfamily)